MSGGPTVRRETQFFPEASLSVDECQEAMSLMRHSADEDLVKKKMKLTFFIKALLLKMIALSAISHKVKY